MSKFRITLVLKRGRAPRGKQGIAPSKRWDPVFSQDRDFKEDDRFMEKMKALFDSAGGPDEDKDRNDFAIFLWDDNSAGLFKYKELENFTRGAQLKDLELCTGDAGHRLGAWIDDRTSASLDKASGVERKGQALTATGLWRHAKHPVCPRPRSDHPNN